MTPSADPAESADRLVAAAHRVAAGAGDDAELAATARFWTGSAVLGFGSAGVELAFDDGRVVASRDVGPEAPDEPGHMGFAGSPEAWRRVLASEGTDIGGAGDMRRTGDRQTYWRYHLAMRRLIELLATSLGERSTG